VPEQPPRAPLVTDAIPPRLRRTGTTPRGVLLMCVIGTLVLGLFASHDLATWSLRFEPMPILARLAGQWDDAMRQFGLAAPNDVLRNAVARLVDTGWGGGSTD
jgi:hypothetical protein